MAKATKKSITNITASHPTCPVVDLSRHLADLWDAEESCNHDGIRDQIDAWRSAVIEIISFTEAAKSLAGSLVQMALAMDDLDTMEDLQTQERGQELPEYMARIERLIESAMRAMQASLGAEFETVKPIIETYSGNRLAADSWLNSIETRATAFRESQTKPDRRRKAA
jgi:hypothetical protein